MPLLVASMGMAVDLATWTQQRQSLQGVADTAAVAAVVELGSFGSPTEIALAATTLAKSFGNAHGAGRTVDVAADPSTHMVTVSITEPARLAFAGLFGVTSFDISAESEAVMVPRPKRACVIALDRTAKTGINIAGSSSFTTKNCTLWSNATSDQSIVIGGSAAVRVSNMCASGRTVINGTSASLTGSRKDRCANLDDPFAAWTGPAPDRPCTARNLSINSMTDVVLNPGTYCGGLRVSAKGSVTLRPGVYIMDGGPLTVTAEGQVAGTDVGIYLTGEKATIDITGQADIRLSADDTGSMAGVVVASDRTQSRSLNARIAGGATVDLIGTVYLPTQSFVWRGNSRTGDPSRVTQVVAADVDIAGTTAISFEADFEAAGFAPINSFPLLAYISR